MAKKSATKESPVSSDAQSSNIEASHASHDDIGIVLYLNVHFPLLTSFDSTCTKTSALLILLDIRPRYAAFPFPEPTATLFPYNIGNAAPHRADGPACTVDGEKNTIVSASLYQPARPRSGDLRFMLRGSMGGEYGCQRKLG